MSEFDIFNLGVEDMNFQEKESKKKVLYSPKYSEGKDNMYKAIIRFIPNPEDPVNKSVDHKFTYWLDEASVNVRGYFDSPQSVGQQCPMASTYWKLKKSDSAVEQNNAEKLKRKEQFHSLAYIIKDPQNPELEGQTMVFRYNKTIKALIDEQAKPDPDLGEDVDPINVFDFFKGKNFLLTISKKGDYPDYTSCKFSSEVSAIKVDGQEVEKTAEGMKIIKEKVLADAPDLSSYGYKELTEEQLSQVYTFLQTLTDDTSHLSTIMSSAGENSSAPAKKAPAAETKAPPATDSSDNLDDEFAAFDTDSSEPAATAESYDASSDDELSAFLDEV